MTALLFLDTETTGLALTDDIWEFAAIRREDDGTETEHQMFIEHDHAKCARLPEEFREQHYDRYLSHRAVPQSKAANRIANFIRWDKPHIVGAVPNFDTERLNLLLSRFNYTQRWHYHLIDVENLAVGYLRGRTERGAPEGEFSDVATPPWESDDLSRAVGVDPDQFERHTAMGDVRWVRAIFDKVMTG